MPTTPISSSYAISSVPLPLTLVPTETQPKKSKEAAKQAKRELHEAVMKIMSLDITGVEAEGKEEKKEEKKFKKRTQDFLEQLKGDDSNNQWVGCPADLEKIFKDLRNNYNTIKMNDVGGKILVMNGKSDPFSIHDSMMGSRKKSKKPYIKTDLKKFLKEAGIL